jgi:hypothetical protein
MLDGLPALIDAMSLTNLMWALFGCVLGNLVRILPGLGSARRRESGGGTPRGSTAVTWQQCSSVWLSRTPGIGTPAHEMI